MLSRLTQLAQLTPFQVAAIASAIASLQHLGAHAKGEPSPFVNGVDSAADAKFSRDLLCTAFNLDRGAP